MPEVQIVKLFERFLLPHYEKFFQKYYCTTASKNYIILSFFYISKNLRYVIYLFFSLIDRNTGELLYTHIADPRIVTDLGFVEFRYGKIKVFQHMLASSGRHGGIFFYRIEPRKIRYVFDRNRYQYGSVVFFHSMANEDDKLIACGGVHNQIIGNYQQSV